MATTTGRIVPADESELHDEPHLEGRRLTVRFVHEQVVGLGRDPETVANEHDLEIADVYRALAFYYDHRDEMAAIERRSEEAIAHHEDRTTDPASVVD